MVLTRGEHQQHGVVLRDVLLYGPMTETDGKLVQQYL